MELTKSKTNPTPVNHDVTAVKKEVDEEIPI